MARPERKLIQLRPGTRERLKARKLGGETYDDVVNRLLDSKEPERAGLAEPEAGT